MKSIEVCIDGILQEIAKRKTVDYGDKASVRRYNAAYRRCFEHMKYIDEHFPDQISVVMTLLSSSDIDVIAHCAPMILWLEHSTQDQKNEAIGAIRNLVNNPQLNPAEKLGFSAMLEKWDA